jgi:RNA polymerase sigma-70 factor (ECF subfamily)
MLLAPTTAHDGVVAPVSVTVPWLQAAPDALLDRVAAGDGDPGGRLTSRETVEIAFIAALQHLSARQRAVVVLRDVVGWPADLTAGELEITVAAANGALARGRRRLRELLGPDRDAWTMAPPRDRRQQALVRQYIRAVEAGDDAAIGALLRIDAVVSHQPGAGTVATTPEWYQGRGTIVDAWEPALHGPVSLHMRLVEVQVNRQPAVASYVRLPGVAEHRAFGLAVLRLDGDQIAEIVNLTPDQFSNVGLPVTL